MQILNATAPHNLFGLEGQEYSKSKFVAIPVPYDSTVSYGTGARHGPNAIIEASRHMELYDERLGNDPSKAGIFTTEEIEPDVDSPAKTVARIEKEVGIVMDGGKVPIILGGEHTVALGGIFAAASRHRDLSVLHFDAHSDSRDSFMGSRYSHACIMARAREKVKSCLSVGVRSIDSESAKKYGKDMLFMKDISGMGLKKLASSISERLGDKVYVTIDLDVLDPSEMPSVGTPEPDGMKYSELVAILGQLLKGKTLVGFDICELAPIPFLKAPDYLAAKLAYKLVAYGSQYHMG